jgi:hypothetical protein
VYDNLVWGRRKASAFAGGNVLPVPEVVSVVHIGAVPILLAQCLERGSQCLASLPFLYRLRFTNIDALPLLVLAEKMGIFESREEMGTRWKHYLE